MMYSHPSELVRFDPPEWMSSLPDVPEYKIKLAHLNTPIQKWNCPGIPDDVELYIKRDDMTDWSMSGDKVRKLEFIMAEALLTNCRHVITPGRLRSNCHRAVSVAARQCGMTPHLMVRTRETNLNVIDYRGNKFLNRLMGSNIYLVAPKEDVMTVQGGFAQLQMLAKQIEETTGEKVMTIPAGASTPTGLFGMMAEFEELLQQNVAENFDDIVMCIGTGGTASGFAIGNYLSKANLKIHAVSSDFNKKYLFNQIQKDCDNLGLNVDATDLIDIVDDRIFEGASVPSSQELEFIQEVAIKTGIVLDTVYTVKVAYWMIEALSSRSHQFKGKRVLFIHTGGGFGCLDGRLTETLKNYQTETNHIKVVDI